MSTQDDAVQVFVFGVFVVLVVFIFGWSNPVESLRQLFPGSNQGLRSFPDLTRVYQSFRLLSRLFFEHGNDTEICTYVSDFASRIAYLDTKVGETHHLVNGDLSLERLAR